MKAKILIIGFAGVVLSACGGISFEGNKESNLSENLKAQSVINPDLPASAKDACDNARKLKASKKQGSPEFVLAENQCQREQVFFTFLRKINDVRTSASESASTRQVETDTMRKALEDITLLEQKYIPGIINQQEKKDSMQKLSLVNENKSGSVNVMAATIKSLRNELQKVMVSLCAKQKSSEDCLP